MDDYRGLRHVIRKSEAEQRRARSRARLLSNVFLGLATSVFTVGLALFGAAFAVRMGLDLPYQELGLLGEMAASIAPTPTSGADAAGSNPRPTIELPTAIPTATASLTPTASPTRTATLTPTASSTPTASLTPSQTPVPSLTPVPSDTPFGTPPPTSTASPTPMDFPDCDRDGKRSFESELLALINAERQSEGLPAYAHSNRLRDAARLHSTDMACNGFFSHTGSDGSSVGDRVFMQNYRWTAVGENIFGSGDKSSEAPKLAFDFWIAGAGNRANLLSEEFTEIGIGYIYVDDSPFGGYFTAVFADR